MTNVKPQHATLTAWPLWECYFMWSNYGFRTAGLFAVIFMTTHQVQDKT